MMEKSYIIPPLKTSGGVGQRNLANGIGFKLTVIISAALLAVFAGKSAYDATVDYSSEIAENTSQITA